MKTGPMLVHGYVPGLLLEEKSFDAILSKDFLHHLPDPSVLWKEVKRLGRRGAKVCVMDLIRPDTPEEARNIVESVASNELPLVKMDFYASLCAAFTVDELKAQLAHAELPFQVSLSGKRHMIIHGTIG